MHKVNLALFISILNATYNYGGLEVMRKPDLVKKQRLMDTQYDYFDFQAKKNAIAKNMPVR